jgi:hypothetical protein
MKENEFPSVALSQLLPAKNQQTRRLPIKTPELLPNKKHPKSPHLLVLPPPPPSPSGPRRLAGGCLPASASPSASGFSCSLPTTRNRAWTCTRRMRPPTPSGTCSRTRPPPWSVSWPPPLPARASCALLVADFSEEFCF